MPAISVSGEGGVERYSLEAGELVIGRGLESDVRLRDLKASRRHCRIARAGGRFQIEDLGSGNGTFVNEEPLEGTRILASGDRIRIGSTEIGFEDDAAPPAPAPAPGRAAGVPTARSNTARMATSKQPTGRTGPVPRPSTQRNVAPTQKNTASVKTGQTGPAPAKSGQTSRVVKTGTQGIRKTTSRTTGATRAQQMAAEAAKPKKNPLVIWGVVAGVIVVGFTIYLFIPSGADQLEELKQKVSKAASAAAASYNAQHYDEATAKYKEVLRLCEGRKEFKSTIESANERLKAIEAERRLESESGTRWEAFKAAYDKEPREKTTVQLLKEANQLKQDYAGAKLTWFPDLEKCLEVLQRQFDTDLKIGEREKFQGKRNELTGKYALDNKKTSKLGPAIVEWRSWVQTKDGEEKRRGEAEIESLEAQARETFSNSLKRAERMVAEEGKPKAREVLEEAFQRLKGSKVEPELREAMSKF